jgi:hypothetical protein
MILTVGPTTARTTATRTMKVDTVIPSSTFELTIDSITAGALGYFNSILKKIAKANPRNAGLLCELIIAEYNERNFKIRSRLTHIKIICLFNRYLRYMTFKKYQKMITLLLISHRKKENRSTVTRHG